MEVLKKDIDDMINAQYTQPTHFTHDTHTIISSDHPYLTILEPSL